MADPFAIRHRLNAALPGGNTLERELGEGGIATVCLAEDPGHNCPHRDTQGRPLHLDPGSLP